MPRAGTSSASSPISKPDTVNVTVIFWNEAVPYQDIIVWLKRHCDLVSDLTKTRDADGIWTGGWRVLVKLRQQHNVTHHLPNSFFIGRERGVCFYAGQPRKCFKCGRPGHVASVCTVIKCSSCNEVGHVSATCQKIMCNLCFKLGHPHSHCPDAWHNICKESPDEGLLEGAEELEEEALFGSIVTQPEPQHDTSDQPQTGAIEGDMEVVQQVVQHAASISSPAPSSNTGENKNTQGKRRKKDPSSRKPEGDWTIVQNPSKKKVATGAEATVTRNRFSVLSESDEEAELERELKRMVDEYDGDPEDDPPTKRRPLRDDLQSDSDMETGGRQDGSDSDL